MHVVGLSKKQKKAYRKGLKSASHKVKSLGKGAIGKKTKIPDKPVYVKPPSV